MKSSKYIVYLNCVHLETWTKQDKYKADMEEKFRDFLNTDDVLVIIDNTQSTSVLEIKM